MVLTVSSALFPVTRRVVVTVAADCSNDLAPALGRQNHAASPSAGSIARRAKPPTSIASRLAFVTTRTPLGESGWREITTISEKTKEKYFCEGRRGQIGLIPFTKFASPARSLKASGICNRKQHPEIDQLSRGPLSRN